MEISPYASEMRTRLILLDISKIKLLNFQENEDFYLLHFIFYNSYSVKLSTDFDSYCYFESDTLEVEELNCIFLDNTKNVPENIVNKLEQFFNLNLELEIADVFHIYQKNEEISKAIINYELLEKESKKLQESKTSMNISNIPKELLFNSNQIYKIIVQEIKNFNKNLKYKHFIEPINNNIYCLKLVCFLNNKNFKNDTFEIKINLEPKLYPYFPPKIEVTKPSIKFQLVFNLMNLKILKLENWNSTISLEWLLISIIEQIDPIIHDYVKLESSKFEELDIKLSSITKEHLFEKELINISTQKVNVTSCDNKFWKSGVGYGDDSRKAWDILSFIKEQEIFNYELTVLLKQITDLISQESLNELYSSSLCIFLINRISGLTLLELEKTKEVYNEILNILDKISKLDGLEQNFINNIGNAFVVISDEIKLLFDLNQSEIYLKIICVSEWFKSKMIVTQIISTEIISTNKNKEYEEVMKKLQFATFEIQPNHLFKEYCAQKPEQKAIVRMVSEISTLKSGLPINWESSIWIRVSKTTINVFSFFISGPKDTPYENGIFEFHTAFPTNYPNSEPKVLINTTGGGTIRFNPNLYNCGKVCLSLLGTWSGQDGEKWNPKTSTFLQVLISIQSLILVENPYFNEPGWEKEMHTTKGQTNSKKYNEPLLIGTIKWAIIDMIKNPPNGMEEVIKNHFKFKKDEILTTTQKWLNEMSSENSKELEKYRNEIILLFNTL
jgi:ubiquitin-protein ligase